ncbi:MAG: hypothetical protein HY716_10840 [Planctomycetes bacterium]|nr:hypothetical protein [Planctomycetota bacterium]
MRNAQKINAVLWGANVLLMGGIAAYAFKFLILHESASYLSGVVPPRPEPEASGGKVLKDYGVLRDLPNPLRELPPKVSDPAQEFHAMLIGVDQVAGDPRSAVAYLFLPARDFYVNAYMGEPIRDELEDREVPELSGWKLARLTATHAIFGKGEKREMLSLTGTHGKADPLPADIGELERKIDQLVSEVIRRRLQDLKDGTPETRARSLATLAGLGPASVPKMETLLKTSGLDLASQARIRSVLSRIYAVEMDEHGLWGQWAVDAKASSEYGRDDWSARQACGEPNTLKAGDLKTAWASKEQNAGEEWLELTYEFRVRPTQVRIHETFNPGAVVLIEARDTGQNWHALWTGRDGTRECPGWLDVRLEATAIATRVIRITLDTSLVAGWNEIDAVQLFGELAENVSTQ